VLITRQPDPLRYSPSALSTIHPRHDAHDTSTRAQRRTPRSCLPCRWQPAPRHLEPLGPGLAPHNIREFELGPAAHLTLRAAVRIVSTTSTKRTHLLGAPAGCTRKTRTPVELSWFRCSGGRARHPPLHSSSSGDTASSDHFPARHRRAVSELRFSKTSAYRQYPPPRPVSAHTRPRHPHDRQRRTRCRTCAATLRPAPKRPVFLSIGAPSTCVPPWDRTDRRTLAPRARARTPRGVSQARVGGENRRSRKAPFSPPARGGKPVAALTAFVSPGDLEPPGSRATRSQR
jgi:hypothetical protein